MGSCQYRFWEFHVFPDCSVQYAGSWGNNPPVPVANVSGYLTYDNPVSTPISNSPVKLIHGNDTLVQVTNNLGHFQFSNIQLGSYQLKANCTKPWGGVNSSDCLKVLQHFTGMSVLSPFRTLAANVDGNTYVNAVDALTILKRIVGMTNSFIKGNWLFESPAITITGQTNININLKGICYGDVDGSYIPAP